MSERSDIQRMSNAPIHVMSIGERKIETRVRPIGPALEWCEQAHKLQARLVEAQSLDDAQARPAAVMAVYRDIFSHVCAYSAEWDAATMLDMCSTEQLVEAFYLLWQVTDPLLLSARKEAEMLGRRFARAQSVMTG